VFGKGSQLKLLLKKVNKYRDCVTGGSIEGILKIETIGDFPMSKANWQTAIERSLQDQDYESLLSICEKAIESDPETLDYYGYVGLGYLLLGHEFDAQDIWMSWLLQAESSEGLVKILCGEIQRHLQTGDLSIAKAIYLQLQALQADSPDEAIEYQAQAMIVSRLQQAKEEIDRQNYRRAETIYHRLLSWNDRSDRIWHDLGYLYYLEERYNQLPRRKRTGYG
jgi:tetratricopeptide (TPR) repeat protein